jgi:di/tricarboxylate transporter
VRIVSRALSLVKEPLLAAMIALVALSGALRANGAITRAALCMLNFFHLIFADADYTILVKRS